MIRYSKQTYEFVKQLGQSAPTKIGFISKSTGFISPGDILIFNQLEGGRQKYYPSDNLNPVVLVVSNLRGKGIFISPRNNMLLSCYHINHLSPELAITIVSMLYKKRRESNYYHISASGMNAIIGQNYRTYNFNFITSIKKLFINIDDLDIAREELE